MRISKRLIQFYMAERKLTVKDLAATCDMKPQNLSNIISRGNCKPITAGRIADGLGVTVMDIIEEREV